MDETETGAAVPRGALLADLARSGWAMAPEALAELRAQLETSTSRAALRAWALAQAGAEAAEPNAVRIGLAVAGGVAIIPVRGVITHRASLIERYLGDGYVASTERLTMRFRTALADPEVRAIVFDVDSPGGNVHGVPEMAAEIFAARGTKPIVAVANASAFSAAYWIASQADEVVAIPSGEVGSIGVWTAHVDMSGFEEKLGVKTTLVSAGKYKVEGNPFEPLSDEARENMQAEVDAIYGEFVKAVARGRNTTAETVRKQYGEGRTLLAGPARKAGMIDRTATLEDTVLRLQSGAPRRRRGSARAAHYRMLFG